jgi:hypothetical protein
LPIERLEYGDARDTGAQLVDKKIKRSFLEQAVTPQIHVPDQGGGDLLDSPYFPKPAFLPAATPQHAVTPQIQLPVQTPVAERKIAGATAERDESPGAVPAFLKLAVVILWLGFCIFCWFLVFFRNPRTLWNEQTSDDLISYAILATVTAVGIFGLIRIISSRS